MKNMMNAGILELESDKFIAAAQAEGKAELMYELVKGGHLSVSVAAEKLGLTEEQFLHNMEAANWNKFLP